MGTVNVSPGAAEKRIDKLGLEALCDRVVAGETLTAICLAIGVNRGSMRRWVAMDEKRRAAMHEARVAAAQAFDEMAETEIRKAKNPFQLAKARDLSHHLRWRASKIDPEYSDKVKLGGDPDAPLIVQLVRYANDPAAE
jgi:transposase-like protein